MGKWFDFGETAKVSLRQIGGRYLVRLELPEQPIKEQLARAYDAGWSRADGSVRTGAAVFDHLQDVRSISDVAARLGAFFPKEKVMAALADKSPKTEVEPERRSVMADATQVAAVLAADAPPLLREHIVRSIDQAKAITGARLAAARQLPFEGDGFGLYGRMVERTDAATAAKWFGSVLYAISEQSEDWRALHDALMEADASGAAALPDFHPHVVAWVVEDVRQTELLNKSGLTNIALSRALRETVITTAGARLGYRAYDGAHIKPAGAPDLAKNSFSAQAGVSGEIATDAKARLTTALTASARAFGLARDRLFDRNQVKFIFATDVNRRIAGARGLAGVYTHHDIKQFTIHITPNAPGALVHEIGHQIHNAGDRDAILREVAAHEFARSTRRIVSALEQAGLIAPQHAEYLMKPAEIFARAFDAHVFNQLGSAASGGSLGSLGGQSYTPVGEELTAFMSDMKAVVLAHRVDAVRDQREEAEQGAVERPISVSAMGM